MDKVFEKHFPFVSGYVSKAICSLANSGLLDFMRIIITVKRRDAFCVRMVHKNKFVQVSVCLRELSLKVDLKIRKKF